MDEWDWLWALDIEMRPLWADALEGFFTSRYPWQDYSEHEQGAQHGPGPTQAAGRDTEP